MGQSVKENNEKRRRRKKRKGDRKKKANLTMKAMHCLQDCEKIASEGILTLTVVDRESSAFIFLDGSVRCDQGVSSNVK